MTMQLLPEAKAAARKLLELDAQGIRDLVDAIAATRPRSQAPDFAQDVAARLPQFPNAAEMVQVLSNLVHLRERHYTNDKLFSELGPAAGLSIPPPKHVRAAIERIIRPDSNLALSNKAYELLLAHEKPWCQARIFTDLRPVFGEEISKGPAAAVIIHNLIVRYHDGEAGDEKVVEFALDGKDLERLHLLVQRAIEKEAAIRANDRYGVLK